MAVTAMRLVDGAREMLLHRRTDLFVTSLDVPFPAVREVSEDRADDDGTRDATSRHGARAVSLELRAVDSPAALVDELVGFCHPSARPYLHLVDDEWGAERRLRLRVDQQSAPMPRTSHLVRDIQAQWVAPDGIWEQTEPLTVVINADTGTLAGRTYPLRTPRTYPMTLPAGAYDHTNPGNTWQHYTARLYGPCNGPRLISDTVGETIAFSSALSIPAGEYVEVDTRDRSALYLSQTGASRLDLVDFATTSWWRLAPGRNQLRYQPISGVQAGCAAVIDYHPAWL